MIWVSALTILECPKVREEENNVIVFFLFVVAVDRVKVRGRTSYWYLLPSFCTSTNTV